MNSYDVFDTIIGRLCYRGTEIFELIENIKKIKNFKNLRIQNESESIDKTYSKLEKILNMNMEEIKELELNMEYDLSFPIKKYLNLIKDGDILVSDMYLSEEQIRKLINKHKHIDNKIYVSLGNKANQTFWRTPIAKNIKLHVGDNYTSDYRNAIINGINASWISNIETNDIEKYFINNFSKELGYIIRAIRLSIQEYTYYLTPYVTSTFLPIGILLCYYLFDIIKKNNIENVIFLSRDGYWFYHIFKILFPEIPSYYKYSSRLGISKSSKKIIDDINSISGSKILFDLVGSGKTIGSIMNNLENTSYFLAFVHGIYYTTINNCFIFDKIDDKIHSNIEEIFSAPHGSLNSDYSLLNPEYNILELKPYMIAINLLNTYLNVYKKYSDINMNINKNILPFIKSYKSFLPHINEHNKNYNTFTLKFFSQIEQDKYYIENICKYKCNGIFLDIGAYDGITGSNTYFLETILNWSGILIEANPESYHKCIKTRTSKCYNNAIYKDDDILIDFIIPKGDELDGGKEQLAGIKEYIKEESLQYFSKNYKENDVIKVKTKNINTILEENKIYHIDYMSLDIEGYELEVLKTINFDKFKIYYITVEHGCIQSYQESIRNFLLSKGYNFVRNNKWDDEYQLIV